MALHPTLRIEALHTEAPHEALHKAPRTDSAYDGSVLLRLVGVEKPRTGHFILIDCDILSIFYWIKDILCSLIRIIQNHTDCPKHLPHDLYDCPSVTRPYLSI